MTVSKHLLLFARVQPSAVIKMVLHYSDELLIINKIVKSQPQWNVLFKLQLQPSPSTQNVGGAYTHEASGSYGHPITIKEALYRIWCGANRLGDGGVHTLGDISAFVNPAGQLLLPGGVRPEWIPSA